MADESAGSHVLELTAQIVAAHVSNNSVPPDRVSDLILGVHRALSGLGGTETTEAVTPAQQEPPRPAVPVRKSVFEDYIICLEDGRRLRTLKRHLKSAFNLTPAQYRERWNLAPDYPMVAPSYARQRSDLAKQIGLGTKPRNAAD